MTQTPLNILYDQLSDDMAAVNDLIIEHMGSDVPMAQTIASGLIEAGGKRIRPLLTLAFGHILGADLIKTKQLAAAVEFIHSATLLHDDVVDESDQRRGIKTANAHFGNAAPILVGDFLFARAFELMVETGDLNVLKLLSKTSSDIAQGEVLQLATKGDMTSGQEIYFKIIEAKTAILFAAGTQSPATLTDHYEEIARAYGLHLGMAFQIMDDVLDYAADAPKLGKSLGDDFREGKLTLPVWIAYEAGNETEQDFWYRTMSKNSQNDEDLATAMKYLRAHNAFDQSIIVAETHVQKAKDALAKLPDHNLTNILSSLVDFVVARDH